MSMVLLLECVEMCNTEAQNNKRIVPRLQQLDRKMNEAFFVFACFEYPRALVNRKLAINLVNCKDAKKMLSAWNLTMITVFTWVTD